jgi:hypothetical protein
VRDGRIAVYWFLAVYVISQALIKISKICQQPQRTGRVSDVRPTEALVGLLEKLRGRFVDIKIACCRK